MVRTDAYPYTPPMWGWALMVFFIPGGGIRWSFNKQPMKLPMLSWFHERCHRQHFMQQTLTFASKPYFTCCGLAATFCDCKSKSDRRLIKHMELLPALTVIKHG